MKVQQTFKHTELLYHFFCVWPFRILQRIRVWNAVFTLVGTFLPDCPKGSSILTSSQLILRFRALYLITIVWYDDI